MNKIYRPYMVSGCLRAQVVGGQWPAPISMTMYKLGSLGAVRDVFIPVPRIILDYGTDRDCISESGCRFTTHIWYMLGLLKQQCINACSS